jgi:hypothetical protein
MVNQLNAVLKELGGQWMLGRLTADHDLREAIRKGFPAAVVKELMRSSRLTLKGLAESVDLSARTLQHWRRSGRLARLESDRLYRWLAWLRWLITVGAVLSVPCAGLSVPIVRWTELLRLERLTPNRERARLRNVLGRIAYGGIS